MQKRRADYLGNPLQGLPSSTFFYLRRLRQLHCMPHCQSRRHEATGVHTQVHTQFGSAELLQLCPCRAASEIVKAVGTSHECCHSTRHGLQPRDRITEAMHNLHWLPLTYSQVQALSDYVCGSQRTTACYKKFYDVV